MYKNIKNILEIWHQEFLDESKHYSEFEASDIEYFVGCMLYNHFQFEYALDTMKTIDLSYDFLSAVENSYDAVKEKIDAIVLEDEAQKLDFLQNYLDVVRSKYTQDELYLLNRLAYHLTGILQRYKQDIKVQAVDFVAPKIKSKNPLDFM